MKWFWKFYRNWSLPIGMATGLVAYFIYTSIPALDATHHAVRAAVDIIQPVLLFTMLFLTFCRVSPHDMKLRRWHLWLLLIQASVFLLGAGLTVLVGDSDYRLLPEALMIAFITPTATAAAVITAKLGGNAATLTTYTMLCNVLVAVLVPLVVPLMPFHAALSFWPLFFKIISRIFPMLVMPLLLAWLVRWLSPRLLGVFQRVGDLAFYLWAVALSIAFAVTTHTFVTSSVSLIIGVSIALITAASCAAQFALGKKIGAASDDKISGGQALGQKNNIFAIWMAYTFFDPISAIGGGFYMVWHNLYNSYQLWQSRREAR